MNTRLMVALDYASWADAQTLVDQLKGLKVTFKVGLELFVSEGPKAVTRLKDAGFDVFLDLKLHDIPNTVSAAARTAAQLKADFLTVHLGGGKPMLEGAVQAVQGSPTQILGVSVLTSFSEESWGEVGKAVAGQSAPVSRSVEGLVALGKGAGVHGIVSSAHELSVVKKVFPQAFCVIPGIRPAGTSAGDQARVMTPAQAAKGGAGAIVVGRPITQAKDPRLATENILAELATAR
jgi:orotidine-5'-phosphate decarboxylase